ncbi:unnamed protein product [Hapterophycus canaliculatus]
MGDDNRSSSDAASPSLRPRGKIVIPDAFLKSDTNGSSRGVTPVTRSTSRQENGSRAAPVAPKGVARPRAKPAAGAAVARKAEPPKLAFDPISPGLSRVKLPLGPSPKEEGNSALHEDTAEEKEKPRVEAKVGDLVEFFMGRGQVRQIREEDGVCTLEVWAMGWEMAGEQRPRFFLQRDAVKVVPTVYYKMPVLERLQIAAWLKEEGAKLFKAGDYGKAAEKYMKSIGVLKTAEFKTNAQNARALEVMIPCHNNAATCYIKKKNYGDARLLAENVDTLCSALERNRNGMVMKALKERGVGETTVLGQWWCKGLFLGGKACGYQGENEEAVNCLKKGSKLAKPTALAKLRAEINSELEKATKRLANQTKKEQKMWTKAFSKNSTDAAPGKTRATSAAPAPAAPTAGKRAKPDGVSTPAMSVMDGAGGRKSVLEQLEEFRKVRGRV